MSKNICLGFASEADYTKLVDDPMLFRDFLNKTFQQYPELFPSDWAAGFTFHDIYWSKKTGLYLRRVQLAQSKQVYSIRPSFVMPYLTVRTDEVEKALYLCQARSSFGGFGVCFRTRRDVLVSVAVAVRSSVCGRHNRQIQREFANSFSR